MIRYLEKNEKTLYIALRYLNHIAVSDFISRVIRLDNPNLLDDYNKPNPLFLVNIKIFLFYIRFF